MVGWQSVQATICGDPSCVEVCFLSKNELDNLHLISYNRACMGPCKEWVHGAMHGKTWLACLGMRNRSHIFCFELAIKESRSAACTHAPAALSLSVERFRGAIRPSPFRLVQFSCLASTKRARFLPLRSDRHRTVGGTQITPTDQENIPLDCVEGESKAVVYDSSARPRTCQRDEELMQI
jgi:hypothetical protein